jgi:cytochrome c peroxidase
MNVTALSGARTATVLLVALVCAAPLSHAATPQELLAAYSAKLPAPPSPERGEKLFNKNFGTQMGLSCGSCHGAVPTKQGKDQITEKSIPPLAPAANPTRFTDRAKVDHWFRLNCKDIVGRDCTAAEKADVLSWLLTLKP